jgi:hypothetical protein
MTTLNKNEFKKSITTFFKKQSGLSITEAKSKIKSVMVIDKYGNSHNESILAGNVKLFYTANTNYAGGLKNGYGKGWYITNQGFTGGSTIKLSNTL